MSADVAVLRESWALISDFSDKVVSEFYGMLFSRYPAIRSLFPVVMDNQRDRLLDALTYVALNLDDLGMVTAYLRELGMDHRKFDVRPEHFRAFGYCLVAAMRANTGEAWRPAYEEAWLAAYEQIAAIMIQAAAEDARSSPPYWSAQVVAHEQRTADIAVITVEPEQSYPFHAGQYTSIQTARWPRVWRTYSIANAPRPDNRLTFHVRLVPGGWVSTALAHQTTVGHRLLLGPPRGSMTLPSPRPDRLLCLAGGTGLAPIKALIEETLRTSRTPDITLIHGVRQQRDRYDDADLTRLAGTPGFRLITALSDDPTELPRKTIAEVVERTHVEDAPATFVCGPAEMVLTTLERLAGLGLPAHRIRSEPDAAEMTHRLRVHAPT